MVMSLQYAGQQFTIYVGFFLLIVGTMGNVLNVYIFASVRTYRTTPYTFYFLAGLTHDIGQLLIGFTTRIISAGYGIDPTLTSTVWCKLRLSFVNVFATVSLTCASLAVVDQFLATSRNARIRQWSKIEIAYRVVICVLIIGWLVGIPWIIYLDISPYSGLCVFTNANFAIFLPINSLVFFSTIPVLVMVTFGCLAYRNIRQTTVLNQQRADRQLTRMICMQVILIAISEIPYGIYNAYSLGTAQIIKNADWLDKELFASRVVALINYGNFAVCSFLKKLVYSLELFA
jgi:hypothetical protein